MSWEPSRKQRVGICNSQDDLTPCSEDLHSQLPERNDAGWKSSNQKQLESLVPWEHLLLSNALAA